MRWTRFVYILLALLLSEPTNAGELRTFSGTVEISEAGEVVALDQERETLVLLINGPEWLAEGRIAVGSTATAQYDLDSVERVHGGKGKGHLIDAAEATSPPSSESLARSSR